MIAVQRPNKGDAVHMQDPPNAMISGAYSNAVVLQIE
jgi:hypothetical protein